MSLMQRQVTDKQTWILIDGTDGITFIPSDVDTRIARALNAGDDSEAERLALGYYDGSQIFSVEFTEGYGARLSAPGYMDCTPWDVFDSQAEAEQYLRDEYPEDEDDLADEV